MKYRIAEFLLAAGVACAQTQPSFEVASIKPSNSADHRPLFLFHPGGRLNVTNFTVKSLIRTAYNVKVFQISGGPSWMDSELFDIAGKPEGPASPDQVMQMLQSLLADRFHLVFRRETRELPVYALVVARNGPKFKPTSESDPPIIDLGRGGAPDSHNRASIMRIRRGLLVGQEANMAGLASQLSNFLSRAVVDKTGLAASYDLHLEWQPDENQVANFQSLGVPEGLGAPAADPLGPSLFTALQEQLGLRLESQKGPVEMFVIERIEKPSEN